MMDVESIGKVFIVFMITFGVLSFAKWEGCSGFCNILFYFFVLLFSASNSSINVMCYCEDNWGLEYFFAIIGALIFSLIEFSLMWGGAFLFKSAYDWWHIKNTPQK